MAQAELATRDTPQREATSVIKNIRMENPIIEKGYHKRPACSPLDRRHLTGSRASGKASNVSITEGHRRMAAETGSAVPVDFGVMQQGGGGKYRRRQGQTGSMISKEQESFVAISEEALQRWRQAGEVQGLSTDTEIAFFLLKFFEESPSRTRSPERNHLCASCLTPLTLVCLTCNPAQVKQDSPRTDSEDSQARRDGCGRKEVAVYGNGVKIGSNIPGYGNGVKIDSNIPGYGNGVKIDSNIPVYGNGAKIDSNIPVYGNDVKNGNGAKNGNDVKIGSNIPVYGNGVKIDSNIPVYGNDVKNGNGVNSGSDVPVLGTVVKNDRQARHDCYRSDVPVCRNGVKNGEVNDQSDDNSDNDVEEEEEVPLTMDVSGNSCLSMDPQSPEDINSPGNTDSSGDTFTPGDTNSSRDTNSPGVTPGDTTSQRNGQDQCLPACFFRNFTENDLKPGGQQMENLRTSKLISDHLSEDCFVKVVDIVAEKGVKRSTEDESLPAHKTSKQKVLESEDTKCLTLSIKTGLRRSSLMNGSHVKKKVARSVEEPSVSARHSNKNGEEGGAENVTTAKRKRGRPKKDQTALVLGDGEKTQFKCSVCSKVFKDKSNCRVHERSHREEGKQHKCDHCSAAFCSSANLKAHRRKHTGERPFFCDTCGKSFARSTTLKQHKRVHTNDRPYRCEECGDAFKQRGMLIVHRRKVHTFERPFSCNICGASFVVKGHLQGHMQCHTGVRPFLCEECGASFKQKGILKTHKMIHKGIRPFSCDVCGKSFYRQVDVRAHKKTHLNIRNVVCTVCGAAFGSNSTLKRHMQKHTGFRPFKCSECEKHFASNSELKVHVRIHTGHKPYICDVCGRGFQTMGNMKKHRNNRHKHAPPYVPTTAKTATLVEKAQKLESLTAQKIELSPSRKIELLPSQKIESPPFRKIELLPSNQDPRPCLSERQMTEIVSEGIPAQPTLSTTQLTRPTETEVKLSIEQLRTLPLL